MSDSCFQKLPEIVACKGLYSWVDPNSLPDDLDTDSDDKEDLTDDEAMEEEEDIHADDVPLNYNPSNIGHRQSFIALMGAGA